MTKNTKVKKDGKITLELSLLEVVTEFFPAITHLGSLPIKNTTITWGLAQARRQAKAHVEDYNEARKQLSEAGCSRNENDEPVIEDKRYVYPDDESETEALKLITELEKNIVKIEVKPFKVGVLRNVDGVTGNSLMSLGDMIIE